MNLSSVPSTSPEPEPVTDPPRDRWRIVVLGNSVPILTVPPRVRREDGTYVEWLERLLRDTGIDATVYNESRLFDLLPQASRRYRGQTQTLFPDVLIINFGIIELQPNVLPTRIVRHLTRGPGGGHGVRGLWRRRAVPLVWPWGRSWQRHASRWAGPRTWRVSPTRFSAELRRLVTEVREQHTLVLVCDIPPPTERLPYFFPGIESRWERYQELLEEAVASFGDPDVRLVSLSLAAQELGPTAVPDGMHLSPPAHRRVAELMSSEITPWLRALGQR